MDPSQNGIKVKRRIDVQLNGDLAVYAEIHTRGYVAESWRNWFVGTDSEGRISGMRNYLSDYIPEVQVNSVEANTTDASSEVTFTVRYDIPEAFHVFDQTIVGRVPAPIERQYSHF